MHESTFSGSPSLPTNNIFLGSNSDDCYLVLPNWLYYHRWSKALYKLTWIAALHLLRKLRWLHYRAELLLLVSMWLMNAEPILLPLIYWRRGHGFFRLPEEESYMWRLVLWFYLNNVGGTKIREPDRVRFGISYLFNYLLRHKEGKFLQLLLRLIFLH